MKKNILSCCGNRIALMAASLSLILGSAHGATLINFPFNEGTNYNVLDTAQGLVGTFGTVSFDPAVDTVGLAADAPSGQVGDGSFVNSGTGFLIGDDSTRVLEITNGPITMESWVKINGSVTPGTAEGVVSYGGSYKMGFKTGVLVFTLLGKKDITNSFVGALPVNEWFHVATGWNPGVGVDFHVTLNGITTSTFVADTNVTARALQNTYLSVGNEGFGNPLVGWFDRVRIHNAVLAPNELDNDALNLKTTYASTKVAYNFNESALPSTNSIAPAIPLNQGNQLAAAANGPEWTNDTPTGLPNDFALSFVTKSPRPAVIVNYGSTPVNLAAGNTNYTLQAWVKLPTTPMEERRVIYRTSGSAPRVVLSINANRTLHTTVLGTADFTTTVFVPNDHRWHHIAMVMTNFAQLRFYLDGVLRQTVNRTQTAAATSGGAANLLIGKESETRFFEGILDRVIINDEALTNSTIDYPAIPGLPTFATFAAHPVAVVTNLGSNAVFTATPTSSTTATYQWYYRTNLADEARVALPGQTTTTLTLNNITAANLGFYSLVASNQVGIAESYSAQLSLPVDLSPRIIGFETPNYVSGILDLQDGWTTDLNQGAALVSTASEIENHLVATGRAPGQGAHSGSQAHLFTGPGVALNSFRTFTGLETETKVTLDFWFRALDTANTGAPIGNVFLRMQNTAGVNAAGFRIGPGLSIDYGLVGANWVATGLVADPATWTRITMQVDYTAKTYDFLVNGTKVNASPIQFYTATSDRFNRINLFKGAGQAGLIMDDISVSGPSLAKLGIRKSGSNVVISWPSVLTGYVLEGTASLTAPNWTTVTHTVVGDENQVTVQPTGTQFYRLKK